MPTLSSRSGGAQAPAPSLSDTFSRVARRIVCLHQEIDHLRQELTASRAESREAAKARAVFLSTMSHEIRTPMNAIMGFIHLFDKSNLRAEQIACLERIRLSSATLLSLLSDVLDLARGGITVLQLDERPFDLAEALETVRSLIEDAATAKGLDFALSLHNQTPSLLVGDALRINQILLNLLNNAIKFTAQGRVALQVEPVSGPASAEKILLGFTVSDTGEGIASERLPALFQPFWQADGSMTRHFGGAGLGLAISKHLVNLMGGSITATSSPHQGTTFNVILPLAMQRTERSGTGTETLRRLTCTQPVLVVDDNVINQEVAAALLGECGLTVDLASSGPEALVMASHKAYACIFMDLQMPGMDGFYTTSRLRDMSGDPGAGWLARVPIIAMTANTLPEDRQHCLEAGMDDHLAKPLDPDRLQQTLTHWLHGAR